MFFTYQGSTQYPIDSDTYKMTDITNTAIISNFNNSILQSVSVNGRSPEQMADDIYGDSSLFWTILYINNVVDPFIDWYMTDSQLYSYCIRIYGESNIYKTRYFKNISTGEYISGDSASIFFTMQSNNQDLPEYITAITNYNHEELKNIKKSQVKIIPKSYISRFVDDYKKALK